MSFLNVLFSPFTLLFGLILVGFIVGKLRIYRISLGIAGVLFVSILAGILINNLFSETHEKIIADLQAEMKTFSTLGSSLFVSVIGLQTGFSIKNNSKKSLICFLIGFLMSLSGVLTMLLISTLDQTISYPSLLGILCGALTSTPGLSSVCDLIGNSNSEAIWGYGCSYIFGVILVVLCVNLFTPKTYNQPQSKPKTITQTSQIYPEIVLICITAMLGYILGNLNIPILNISIGSTACDLIIGLLIGYILKKFFVTTQISHQVFDSFRNLGLSLFFVGNGLTTGMKALKLDTRIVTYGMFITLSAILIGWLLCKLLLSKQRLHTGFVIAGGMTSSPAYGAISSQATELSVNCFSFAYFGSLLSLIAAIQVICR